MILLVRDWARDGLLLIGDAAHTMSPAGAIGVNVALATAAVAAQEIYPRLGHGPIPEGALARVQELREPDVRTLHALQRRAGRALLGSGEREPADSLARADGRCRWPSARGCSRGSSGGCSSAPRCRRSTPRSASAPARPPSANAALPRVAWQSWYGALAFHRVPG